MSPEPSHFSQLIPAKSLLSPDSVTILTPVGAASLPTTRSEHKDPLNCTPLLAFSLRSLSTCFVIKLRWSYATTSGKLDRPRSFRPPTQYARNSPYACSCHPGLSASPSMHLILPQDLDTCCSLHAKYFCVSELHASCITLATSLCMRHASRWPLLCSDGRRESLCLLIGSTEFTVPLGTHRWLRCITSLPRLTLHRSCEFYVSLCPWIETQASQRNSFLSTVVFPTPETPAWPIPGAWHLFTGEKNEQCTIICQK